MNRQNDYQHYIVCPCGWRGFSADMKHTYIGSGFNGELDVEPIDLCPKCGADEGECETYNIVQRRELVLI